jgi:signal transduction histidine kinase
VPSLAFFARLRAPRPYPADALARPLPAAWTLAWAAALGVALSTQYLFQPFVWLNWEWTDVLAGWGGIVVDRTLVALAIASATLVASRARSRSRPVRIALLAGGIVAGAAAGEMAVDALDSWSRQPGWDTFALAVLHWSVLAGGIVAMHFMWQRMVAARAQAQAEALRAASLERHIAQARLASLRRQIEPHFLFNTLATIRHLHEARPDDGARVLRRFLDYLHLSAESFERDGNTLAQEIALVRAYLDVIVVRMSGRLRTQYDIPDPLLDCPFPSLVLATLVENAVKHGIAPRPQGGTITVTAERTGDVMQVVVADDGAGFANPLGSGIGLANIRARLRTLYGAQAALTLQGNHPRGVRASVRLPCTPAGASV